VGERTQLGLIGCGQIADLVHLDILRRLSGVELVALVEVDPARRERARRRVPAAAAFESYEELLAVAELDAVVICLPNALHAEATVAALRHRKHVYLEKPLATSLDDARRVLEAWERADVVGMMGFNYRFNPLYCEMKRRLDAGRLGSLVAARSTFSTVARGDLAWRGSRRRGGGVLLDLAPHHVDLMRFLFGREVHEVSATLHSHRSEDDTAMVQLRFAGGLLAQSFFCLSAVEEDRLEVYEASARSGRTVQVEPVGPLSRSEPAHDGDRSPPVTLQ
jgi:myo-inositol 2-dehydrogenase / D-chiro-inositol 1-dehydrogenase